MAGVAQRITPSGPTIAIPQGSAVSAAIARSAGRSRQSADTGLSFLFRNGPLSPFYADGPPGAKTGPAGGGLPGSARRWSGRSRQSGRRRTQRATSVPTTSRRTPRRRGRISHTSGSARQAIASGQPERRTWAR